MPQPLCFWIVLIHDANMFVLVVLSYSVTSLGGGVILAVVFLSDENTTIKLFCTALGCGCEFFGFFLGGGGLNNSFDNLQFVSSLPQDFICKNIGSGTSGVSILTVNCYTDMFEETHLYFPYLLIKIQRPLFI